eukprot:6207263-Pleurochrysis_carterae.AAC.1
MQRTLTQPVPSRGEAQEPSKLAPQSAEGIHLLRTPRGAIWLTCLRSTASPTFASTTPSSMSLFSLKSNTSTVRLYRLARALLPNRLPDACAGDSMLIIGPCMILDGSTRRAASNC